MDNGTDKAYKDKINELKIKHPKCLLQINFWASKNEPIEVIEAQIILLEEQGKELDDILESIVRNFAANSIQQDEAAVESATTDPSAMNSGQDQPSGLAENVFRKEGAVWAMSFGDDEIVRLPDMKGFNYIAYLLSRPNKDISVVELATIHAKLDVKEMGEEELKEGNLTSSKEKEKDIGTMLDPVAKREYQEAINKIDNNIEIAEDTNNTEKVASLKEEKRFIAMELASAMGLAGRDRKLDDKTKNLADAVRKCIKDSIEKIKEEKTLKLLSQHLEEYIKTGYFCRYCPIDDSHWNC